MCTKCNSEMIEKTSILFWIFVGITWVAMSFFIGMMISVVGLIVRYAGIGFIISSPLLSRIYRCRKCNKLFWTYPETCDVRDEM